ncbi:hypothetical protein BDP55DRAFT_699031 [Colletotrichum godetiae]|uniref:Uncharacterized protein n=1 Tax=Colletotrichum godetiae TaxID=1209918 RepID=A0AAJ0A6D8_9PEZI|nr:uncharacterized protein BDP55DRAFT_699031 [Colletotrichum godetiae]KAK1657342.1 hypothetical protein BDP55DRAFT_699031 [Colletotrichum godetiae]
MSNLSLLDRDPVNAKMPLAHGTLVHNGRSLDGQEYQRGDPVAIVENGPGEHLPDALRILIFRTNQCMLVPLKAVCWIPTHTEQRSGTTFLLTLYGSSLDFRQSASEPPQMGYRGIATLYGSCVYVGREVMLEGNPSRVNLEPTNRTSLFTAQWDALSLSEDVHQHALTPSASSYASSRSPSESGDDVPHPPLYRVQGRRDSAIDIRDPESPIYESSMGRMVNFVSMPQNESSNYVLEQRDQQRQGANAQEPMWATRGSNADNGNTWDTLQMPPQHVPEMRQPQLPMPQRQQAPTSRAVSHADYYEQYRLAEEQGSSRSHNGPVGHRPQQLEAVHMQNDPRAGYLPSRIPSLNDSQSIEDAQMHPRGLDQSNRLPMPGPSFPMPEEFYDIQSNRPTFRPSRPPPSSSYSQVQEDSLPSTFQRQQPRRSPRPDDSHPSRTRRTPIMACRAPAQPVHTFTPSVIIDSFRQSTQAHISSLESHCEQLQQSQASVDQVYQANESLQAARRNNEESLQLLRLLQPNTGIPLKGTEKRLQSIVDQIIDAIKKLLPDGINGSDMNIEQLSQNVQSLKEFIEYVEGVYPEVIRRAQDPAAASTNKSQSVPVTTTNQVPSAPASVSSHTADESDSRRWVDGQAAPPSDRSAATALNRDRSRILQDMTAACSRRPEPRLNTAPEYYAPNSYRRPSSRTHSPLDTPFAPAEPPDAAGHGFFQRRPPTQIQQTMPITDFAALMQDQTTHAYPSPTSVEMMRPMQPVSSPLPQPYTMQQESNFYLRSPPPNCLYPATGAEVAQAAYSPRSSVGYQPAPGPAESNYYQDKRSGLSDWRTVRQERPAPYSLNYRDQRRRRGSQ